MDLNAFMGRCTGLFKKTSEKEGKSLFYMLGRRSMNFLFKLRNQTSHTPNSQNH
jgi:hypothetical protein